MTNPNTPNDDNNAFNLNDYLLGPVLPKTPAPPTLLNKVLQNFWDKGSNTYSYISKKAENVANGFLDRWSNPTTPWLSAAIVGGLLILIISLIVSHIMSDSPKPVFSLPGRTQPPIIIRRLQNLQSDVRDAGPRLQMAGVSNEDIQDFQRTTLLTEGMNAVSRARQKAPEELISEKSASVRFQVTQTGDPSHYVSVQQMDANRFLTSLSHESMIHSALANSIVIHDGTLHQNSAQPITRTEVRCGSACR